MQDIGQLTYLPRCPLCVHTYGLRTLACATRMCHAYVPLPAQALGGQPAQRRPAEAARRHPHTAALLYAVATERIGLSELSASENFAKPRRALWPAIRAAASPPPLRGRHCAALRAEVSRWPGCGNTRHGRLPEGPRLALADETEALRVNS